MTIFNNNKIAVMIRQLTALLIRKSNLKSFPSCKSTRDQRVEIDLDSYKLTKATCSLMYFTCTCIFFLFNIVTLLFYENPYISNPGSNSKKSEVEPNTDKMSNPTTAFLSQNEKGEAMAESRRSSLLKHLLQQIRRTITCFHEQCCSWELHASVNI